MKNKKMRIFLVAFLSLLISGTSIADYFPVQKNLDCQICFERFEDNGSVNILPAEIVIDNYQRVVLLGGQAACIFVRPGSYSFFVQSRDPYNPKDSNSKAWISKKFKVSMKKGQAAKFEVAPRSKGSTYIGGWVAKSVK